MTIKWPFLDHKLLTLVKIRCKQTARLAVSLAVCLYHLLSQWVT